MTHWRFCIITNVDGFLLDTYALVMPALVSSMTQQSSRYTCDVKVRIIVTITRAHIWDKEDTSACCPARQQRPQRALKLPFNLSHVFDSVVPFKCLFYSSVFVLFYVRRSNEGDGIKGWFFSDTFFVLSTAFVSMLESQPKFVFLPIFYHSMKTYGANIVNGKCSALLFSLLNQMRSHLS